MNLQLEKTQGQDLNIAKVFGIKRTYAKLYFKKGIFAYFFHRDDSS